MSAINVHICSVVLGCAGSYVPGRSATYENQEFANLETDLGPDYMSRAASVCHDDFQDGIT